VIIVSHGLSSSGLFCIVNIFYERLRRRRLYLNKGLLIIFPSLRLLVFILCAANISAPPTINLIGEIFLILSLIGFRKFIIILFPLGSFLGAAFTLFIFSYSQHGKNYFMGMNYLGITINDLHNLIIHIIPLNLIILKTEFFFYYLSSL
jgi:NADH-ubiquinone oxidoreductase chain 4